LTWITNIGLVGYGRDASIGLGKFDIEEVSSKPWPMQKISQGYLTLAPCAPQGMGFDPELSYYQPFTRFGRHGDVAAHRGHPFKSPILLADTGAILTPFSFKNTDYIGQGLGGDGSISQDIPKTVHQGYAPILSLNLEKIIEKCS
jgi:CRISPR-associated protein Csm4